MTSSNQAVPIHLPVFQPPKDIKLWELGKKENWFRLWELISPLVDGDFSVKDRRSQVLLDKVRSAFDSSTRSDFKQEIVSHMIWQEEMETNITLLEQLVSLGVNPDVPNAHGYTPIHDTAWHGRPNVAKCLTKLRVDFHLKNGRGRTVREEAVAKQNELPDSDWHKKVADFVCKHADAGFPTPTIAELTAERAFYAVFSLIRRGVVPQNEVLMKYEGKTVVEWAEYHKEFKLRDELLYRYPQLNSAGTAVLPLLVERVEVLEKKVLALVEILTASV